MTAAKTEAVYAAAAAEALAEFPVTVGSIELIQVSENITWRVTDDAGCRYVLRLHRPGYHELDELISERCWMRALNAAGVAVPRGIHTRGGEEYATVAVPGAGERRHVGLAYWTDGEVLDELLEAQAGSLANPELVERWFGQLGALIASMHNQASGWDVPDGFTRHSLDADGLMGQQPFWGRFWEHDALDATASALLARARARLHADLAALPRTPDTYGLIHADLHAGNLLVHESKLAVIDFDDAGFGWHQYDLAVALLPYRDEPNFWQIHEAVLRGYRSRRALADAAAALIPQFMLIRRLASVGWRMQRPELGLVLAQPDIDELCEDVRTFLAS